MTDTGHGVQIVNVVETVGLDTTHSFELDEKALADILLDEKVKDLPVVVVSVAGAYRTGKSFLLNFFLRYLKSSKERRQNDSWLGDDSEPLAGFKWRSGSKRTTTGILIWSEPFIMYGPSGKEVAVILMDTQGTFDNTSTVRDNSTIFALSTLLSSVQIYNISLNIQEDDLQNLQLFTEYGKLVSNEKSKPFQVLEFLVRDWQFPQDYAYGAAGGEKLLQDKLKVNPTSPQELQEVRKHIGSSFEKLSCFLMPHPGFEVLDPNFDGRISDIRRLFRDNLKDLVKSLFGSEKLLPKTINGDEVKAKDLYQYFKTYMKLYTSEKLPNPTSIMKATVEAGLLLAMNEARDVYEKEMDAECGPKQLSVPAAEIPGIHNKNLTKARAYFNNKKKMGSKEEADEYLKTLTEELKNRLQQFAQSNLSKIQKAMKDAEDSYYAVFQNITGGKPLCVHPQELVKAHTNAVSNAMKIFDNSRKPVLSGHDDERNQFLLGFENRWSTQRQMNEHNNKVNISLLSLAYDSEMLPKAGQNPPLSVAVFEQEHEKAKESALKKFESKRNTHTYYKEDIHKFNLSKAIKDSFNTTKSLYEHKNSEVIIAVVNEYKNFMKSVWDAINNTDFCVHPSELQIEHNRGLCQAILTYRPNKAGIDQEQCAAAYDLDDSGEKLLKQLIDEHYKQVQNLNDSANESAVTSAFNVYRSEINDKCGFSIWWIISIGILYFDNLNHRNEFHSEAKKKAFIEFDGRRRRSGRSKSDHTQYNEDKYRNNLEQIMDQYFKDNY